jgi:hypothetical protein
MKKIVISILLTLLLGPGMGHLYLKKFKKAALLLSAAFALISYLAWIFARSIDVSKLETMTPAFLYSAFTSSHPKLIFYYDVVFAALWAYAVVDAFFTARAMMPPKEEARD